MDETISCVYLVGDDQETHGDTVLKATFHGDMGGAEGYRDTLARQLEVECHGDYVAVVRHFVAVKMA